MLRVTTSPQGFISFLLMLLNTGTQLTWHCKHRWGFFFLVFSKESINTAERSIRSRDRMLRDTWKPKHMVGMALNTAVQEDELEQTEPLGRV